jgi:DNA gyrase subunit A
MEATPDERAAYLKRAIAARRGLSNEAAEAALEAEIEDQADLEEAAGAIELGDERYEQMRGAEQFVLTVSERGFGKRTSSYEYRITGRGGKGIVTMDNAANNRDRVGSIRPRIGRLVASLPVQGSDQLMLVTDGGQLIRVPVEGIRTAGRKTQGVIVFNTTDGERVVSVERVGEDEAAAESEASGAEASGAEASAGEAGGGESEA